MELTLAVIFGIAGWVLALFQFIFNFRESKRKHDDELLEKTLAYFERGIVARSMAISFVEGIWFQRKKHLNVIVPVLISQVEFLLTVAENYAHERNNLLRLLWLLIDCLPYSNDPMLEIAELEEIFTNAVKAQPKIEVDKAALKDWYESFNKRFDKTPKKIFD